MTEAFDNRENQSDENSVQDITAGDGHNDLKSSLDGADSDGKKENQDSSENLEIDNGNQCLITIFVSIIGLQYSLNLQIQ